MILLGVLSINLAPGCYWVVAAGEGRCLVGGVSWGHAGPGPAPRSPGCPPSLARCHPACCPSSHHHPRTGFCCTRPHNRLFTTFFATQPWPKSCFSSSYMPLIYFYYCTLFMLHPQHIHNHYTTYNWPI